MLLKIYSIFDSAASAYTQPFFMHNDALALRAFEDNVNAENNNIASHPDQFTLFCIGEYDDTSGAITSDVPRSLGNGQEYKKQPEKDKDLTSTLSKILMEIQELKS
jgi:hypothetical protein